MNNLILKGEPYYKIVWPAKKILFQIVECKFCNKEFEIRHYEIQRNLYGCITCSRSKRLKVYNNEGIASTYFNYKEGAKRRELDFSISFEDFITIISLNCHYCGQLPQERNIKYNKRKYKINVNGLDRKDSQKDYTIENCLPCCTFCNRAKGNSNYKDFIEYLNNLVKFRSNSLVSLHI